MTETDVYSPQIGLIYVFNLIVGTGALTMPAAFAQAGWILSLIVLTLLCIMSFITVTFVVEAMSIANAVKKSRRAIESQFSSPVNSRHPSVTEQSSSSSSNIPSDSLDSENRLTNFIREKDPLISEPSDTYGESVDRSKNFDITERVELGEMANLFFPKSMVTIFYLCIAVYLYGDLAIYAAAIAKSVRDMSCTWEHPCNGSHTEAYTGTDICWLVGSGVVDRSDAYRIYVLLVLVALGPFAFFNVQKTKYIQLLTTFFRWTSFSSMIVLASIALFDGKARGVPKKANISGLPNLFGVCVYSFMCHHSLPSLITPIKRKRNIYGLLFADYLLIIIFYSLLSLTGVFAFDHIQDIYTLNFERDKCATGDNLIVPTIPFLQYFLPLFPVFTLSASFPIISITLANNIRNLFSTKLQAVQPMSTSSPRASRTQFFVNRLLFPLLAIIPPTVLALTTENLQILVGITGSYAGTCIQYIIPAMLVYHARQQRPLDDYVLAGEGLKIMNRFKSPLRDQFWVFFVLLWAAICVFFVTLDHILA